MEDIKMSELLEQLIAKAKTVGTVQDPPATAERFVVALIDRYASEHENCQDKELLAAIDVLNNMFSDLQVARSCLLAYIGQEKSLVRGQVYMRRALRKAAWLAQEAGAPEVDTAALLCSFQQNPSQGLIPLINVEIPEPEPLKLEDDVAKGVTDDFDMLWGLFGEPDASFGSEKPAPPSVRSQMETLVADVKRIRAELQSHIFGQDNAINVFVSGYFQANMLALTDSNRKRPKATFLFAGPPGVGKTFLAESAAEALKLPFARFDMSEYGDKEATVEFCGADKVYRNAKAGNVTGFVAQHPKCVLLFDEIEKAHMSVIHLFLQMLDAGRLRDNYTDKEVSFQDAIIILTTNAGKQLYDESESGDFSAVSRKVIVKALQKDVNTQTNQPFFPGAICSRFASGNVVMFNHIGAHNLVAIAKKEIRRHADNLEEKTGIRVQIDERVYAALLFSEGSAADARTIRGRAETFFNDELYELLRLISSEKAGASIGGIERICVDMELDRAGKEIQEIFMPADKTQVLAFAEPETVALSKAAVPEMDVIGVQDLQAAVRIIKERDIGFILLDMKCGASEAASLNIEDVESPARDFFKFIREQGRGLPVFLLEDREGILSEEERVSFLRQGVRGVLSVADGKDALAERLCTVASNLHRQGSMVKLARANKLISFETAQTISRDGKDARIKLFDFALRVAVDSEDSKNILSAVSKPDVRFDDVIGATDAKKELKYFVEYLKNPKKYLGTGVKAPKGIILHGPPGTGKTMLAKAMACEAGVTFIAAEGNQFLTKYIGEGSDKVHELFKTARKYAPSILFIDEIDAIAKERRGGEHAASNGENTLTAFLTEMDGFINDPSKPVFVLAATNFDVEPGGAKSLDPALMRRFDRRVYIDLPNREDRVHFLKMKIAKNRALDISDGKVENLAMRAIGMSLSELDSVVELALRSAIREGSTTVNDGILEEAFETFHGGEVKKWDMSLLERVARHEAGHAFLCWLSGETPSYLTIVARGKHGGYMQQAEQEGKELRTKDELLAHIRTSLGGRAAEIAYYGERDGLSTGASGDLASATYTAQQLLCAYGMDEGFGPAVVNGNAAVNGAMSVEVRSAVNRILNEQLREAVRLISENRDKMDSLVETLMSRNHLNGAEIEQALTKNAGADASGTRKV